MILLIFMYLYNTYKGIAKLPRESRTESCGSSSEDSRAAKHKAKLFVRVGQKAAGLLLKIAGLHKNCS